MPPYNPMSNPNLWQAYDQSASQMLEDFLFNCPWWMKIEMLLGFGAIASIAICLPLITWRLSRVAKVMETPRRRTTLKTPETPPAEVPPSEPQKTAAQLVEENEARYRPKPGI